MRGAWWWKWSVAWAVANLFGALASAQPVDADTGHTLTDRFAPPAKPAPVIVWGREIAVFRSSYGNLSAAQRASVAEAHILEIPVETHHDVELVKGTEGPLTGALVKVNGQRIFGVLDTDLDPDALESFDEFSAAIADRLQQWLAARNDQLRWPILLRSILVAVLATLAFGATLWLLVVLSRRWLRRRQSAAADPDRQLKLGDVNVRPYLIALETGLYKFVAWGLALALGYGWLTFVLSQFLYSQIWGARLREYLIDVLGRSGLAVLKVMPDIFTVVVILLLARLVSKVIYAFFRNAESGTSESLWLEPESARTTRRLLCALIWIFALIIAYPYIPGSDTAAFKGVSVFLGLMVSLGSAGMVGQVVGGLVVVYSRAFRTGDHIKVGEHEGIVQEVGVLSTKLETRTRDEISIPNAVLLAATTINYSRIARKEGWALVTTKLTIGYDAPWRQVHAMLEMAAARTTRIKTTPAPWVMQSALSDFYPEYVLIVAIERSEERYAVLSELHGNIQDIFNESGVQIMSPHFEAQPEEAVLAKPGSSMDRYSGMDRVG